ncbi:uncharacterized protein LOC103380750 [Cynoglossus semilaevis]|uniref:Si:ch211-212k18.9 n=1 Tax=Cynoglossus semilaevis TaxID=244447 RepID=A0A3P8VGN9_CYNSE|nr:uncharacterized protein LOC103380750 [Cynoglossus semilaevis]
MEEEVVKEDTTPAQSPLVAVSFQQNHQRAQKYLEAEPKALGVTQIVLSVFQITCVTVFLASGLSRVPVEVPCFICSILVIIAGGVAVAAQNLRLPTLRACLGMQVVACIASFLNLLLTLDKVGYTPSICWHYSYENMTQEYGERCYNIESAVSHLFAECAIIQAVMFAISVTLASYCCKVVNCCTTGPKMTVITVQAPAVQQ